MSAPTDRCYVCDGSGVLMVEGRSLGGIGGTPYEWTKYAAHCHGCEMGRIWFDLGLGMD